MNDLFLPMNVLFVRFETELGYRMKPDDQPIRSYSFHPFF